MRLVRSCLIATTLGAALFTHAAHADQLDDIKKKGEIVFGVLGTDEPNSFVDPITPPGSGNAIQSAVKAVTGSAQAKTRRQLLADMALGGRHAPIVGSAARVADELQAWVHDTGIDGFNTSPAP